MSVDPAIKAAVIADCLAGMPPAIAARKHGVSESSAYRWVQGTSQERRAAELAYVGGWEVRRGVRYPLFPEARSA